MQKTLVFSSMIMISLLLAGSLLLPASAPMWLASSAPETIGIRCILLGLLAGLFFTEPPRKRTFRFVLGVAAVSLAAVTIGTAYSNLLQPLDALVYLETSILFGLAALEPDPLLAPDDVMPETI